MPEVDDVVKCHGCGGLSRVARASTVIVTVSPLEASEGEPGSLSAGPSDEVLCAFCGDDDVERYGRARFRVGGVTIVRPRR